jgi:23S rRNA (uracil1939-C5)-methyltransferase
VQVVTIDRIAAGGDGVGRTEGLAVFVPRTAPGDVVQVAYVTQARHGRGRVLQVLTPSPDRVAPECMHYERDRCGGCQLQHLSLEAQRTARRHIVQDTLARIGRRTVPLPLLEYGAAWEYRSRLSLTLRRRGTSWVGGLHPHDDATRIFPLETCRIAHPALVAVWTAVRAVLRAGEAALPGVALPSGGVSPVEMLRLHLRLDAPDAADASPGVSVVIEGGTAWPEERRWADAVQQADDRIRGVWWTPDRVADIPATARPVSEYAPQAQEAMAFAQVNNDLAARLRDFVFGAVQAFGPSRVLDGYAGSGLLSARLAAAGVAVVAVEADRAGAGAAAARLEALGEQAASARVVCDLMEEAVGTLDLPAEVVVVNPPRRGLHPDVALWLEAPAQRAVQGIVYVSCDPATLARDLARLPSWQVGEVRCFDMFPQTAHVETVCVLRREIA